MPEYMNVSNAHLQVAEHRFVAPKSHITLTPEEAEPLMKGGWLIPILTEIGQEVIDGEISNFFNHISHIPSSPIDVNVPFPINSVISHEEAPQTETAEKKANEAKKLVAKGPVKQDPPYIKEALDRYKLKNATKKLTDVPAPGVLDQRDVFDSDKFQ